MPVRLFLADDHPIVRIGVTTAAQTRGMEVVGHTSNVDSIAPLVAQLKPDLLITEVRLGSQDALKAIEDLPPNQCGILVLTAYDNPSHIARAAALGCHDFLLKTESVETILSAIQNAAAGNPTPASSRLVTTKSRMRRNSKYAHDSPLTNRETQVLRHVSMGLKNREIGKSLGISVETVKEHVQNILRKLNVNDRTQAAVWAIKKDFI